MEIDLRTCFVDNPPTRGPIKIRCQEHEDSTASLAVYPDGLYCFGCQFQIQNTKKALEYLKNFEIDTTKVRGISTRREVGIEVPLTNSMVEVYHEYLCERRRNSLHWLYDRTLSNQTIKRFKLGHDGTRFTIPIYDDNFHVYSIRYRRDDLYLGNDSPKYSGSYGRNQPYLYPAWLQSDPRPWRVVIESELCACRLWQDDIPAATITNGAGQLGKLLELLEPYEHIRELYIASDLDRAGNAAYRDIQLNHQSRFIIRPITWKREDGKDVTETYQTGKGEKIFGWYREKKRVRVGTLNSRKEKGNC